MKKAFTLLELIVVIIILGILATLGFSQYTKMVEKGRTSEAKMILSQIRTAEQGIYLETGAYRSYPFCLGGGLDGCTGFPLDIPTDCDQTTHYFQYRIVGPLAFATRCTGLNGKQPGVAAAYSITLNLINGDWSGTPGYF